METSIMIIGFVFIAIVVLPIYFILKSRKINHKHINALFVHYSQGGTYRFKLVATSQRKALGIDADNKGLLFIDFNLSEPHVSFQDLSQSSSCEVAISNALGRTNALEKVEWLFMSKNGTPKDTTVVFHDAEKNYLVPVYAHEELQLAQQWQETIKKYM